MCYDIKCESQCNLRVNQCEGSFKGFYSIVIDRLYRWKELGSQCNFVIHVGFISQ